ncbi:MAG TPA: tetratricopeptide repeat protein [Candidatus Sulfotelmatobacter sp.]|jgi:tetratricopeptide (TPR) repeat protein|nr:tetratricopeptide repeat protein [Candidatus Sulfotelmatobacter sp.]
MKPGIWIVVAVFLSTNAHACIWDADSLWQEKMRSHDLTTAILGDPPEPEDPQKLRARISELESHRDETNADWWNNLAGAHLRLNEPAEAVKILEPVVTNFPDNYGIHANLGTAYHLLGRYAAAEKEIARDLQINPDAHFGLEKYHLALLQYLMRDTNYQSRHVYVDELTAAFLSPQEGRFRFSDAFEKNYQAMSEEYTNGIAEAEADYESARTNHEQNYDVLQALGTVAAFDPSPGYRTNWNLATDTNFQAGVIYMAQMNPKEPAAFEMIGIAAWRARDYHLAVSAFERASALGSKKQDVLRMQIAGLNHYIANSPVISENNAAIIVGLCMISIPVLLIYYIYTKIRDRRHNRVGAK